MTTRRLRRTALLSTAAVAFAIPLSNAAFAADLPPPPPPVVASPMIVAPVHVPRVYVSLQALYMTRSNPAPTPILIGVNPLSVGENEVADGLDAEDINYGWSLGVAGRVGFIGDPIGFDVGGFWLQPLRAHVDMYGDEFGNYFFPTDEPTPIYITYDDPAAEAWAYTSLYGADANVTFNMSGGFQLFAGVAYVNVKDDLQVNVYPTTNNTIDANWTTFNRLIGPQIGVRSEFGQNAFTFGFDGRIAYLFNSASGYASMDDDLGIDFTETMDAVKDRTLMVAGGVHASFNVSDNLSLNVGYQAMWFRNLALAPAQVGGTDPVAPSLTLDTSSSLLVHGVHAGFTFRF